MNRDVIFRGPKMWKNMVLRVRKWLIKKLGGYTEQFQPIQLQTMRTAEVQIQKVQVQISMEPVDGMVDFKRYCEDKIMCLLMRELYRSGFILWERQNDFIMQKVNVRATLNVVNANDLTPYSRDGGSELWGLM